MLVELKKVIADCAQSANGDYDPARVVGYSVSLLGALVFLGLSIYTTVINRAFDASGFAVGLAGVSATIAAAAGGVWMKKSTEIPFDPTTQNGPGGAPDVPHHRALVKQQVPDETGVSH